MGDTNEAKPIIIHLRVSADWSVVEYVATLIGEQLQAAGYELIEQTDPIPSRFTDREGRIYMTVR